MNKKPEPVSITRISSDQLKDYIDKVNKVVYLCDGTARACKELKRNFYGFEINKEFYRRAKEEMIVFPEEKQISIFD